MCRRFDLTFIAFRKNILQSDSNSLQAKLMIHHARLRLIWKKFMFYPLDLVLILPDLVPYRTVPQRLILDDTLHCTQHKSKVHDF